MSEVKLYVKGRPNGLFADTTRPATAEEIKEAHPKCGTCSIWEGDDDMPEAYCDYAGMRMLRREYCHHHTPKAEGDEGAQS